ncbi:hypothetical protein D3C78_1120140 [compost metagenome]
MRGPGHFQRIDILLVDLIQRGKAVTVGGVPPVRPVFLLLARRNRFNRNRLISGNERLRFKHPAKAHQHRQRENGRHCECRCFIHRHVAIRRTQEWPDKGTQKGEDGEGEQAREQRPEIPASVIHRPNDRRDKGDSVKNNPADATGKN